MAHLPVFNAPSDSRNHILVSPTPESAAAHTLMELPWHRVDLQRVFVGKKFGKGADLCLGAPLSLESPLCLSQGSLQRVHRASLASLCRNPLCWPSCEEQGSAFSMLCDLVDALGLHQKSREGEQNHRLKRKEA